MSSGQEPMPHLSQSEGRAAMLHNLLEDRQGESRLWFWRFLEEHHAVLQPVAGVIGSARCSVLGGRPVNQ